MTDHIAHSPGLHCHHDTVAAECTLCTYLAMEKAHDETLELLLALEQHAQDAQTPTQES